jgi:hypothetical protein|nr:MAG TPA: Major tail protein [Bacteriophage sp.]
MELKLYRNFPINDYANQVYYSNQNTRDAEFDKYEDRAIKDLASCDKTKRQIRLNVSYYVGNQYNYGCIIENNKRYYIFIDSVEWKSNLNTVILHYSYDYWQTYCYQITLKDSYVEREHVADDTFGKHIIDEGLPIDEYKVQSSEVLNGDNDGMYFCISVSDTNGVISTSHNSQESIPSTCRPSKYEQSVQITFSDDLNVISRYLDMLVLKNKIDGISGLYSIPKVAIPSKIQKQGYDWDTGEDDVKYVGYNNDLPTMITWDLPKPKNIDGYEPINKKCFTYPYCFANITNNNGSSLYGQFELANDRNSVKFRYYFPCIEGNVSFGYLAEYDGVVKNFDKSIQGQTNIELPFVTNTFSAYMSANQNSIANQYSTIDRNETASIVKAGVNGAVGIVGSLATGNVAGAISSGIGTASNIADATLSAYNQRQAIDSSLKDQESKANVSHGAYTGVGNIICGQIGFKGQLITVTAENIKMIDDYFSMFGYKVNTIKKPELNTRPYWNYIKTSGVNMIGNVPQDALNVLKQMFDSGVTMWHRLSYMYKYDDYKRLNV